MRTASKPEGIPKNSVATIGTFDGVHLGHQAILKELRKRTQGERSESLLITFDPPPPLFFGTATSLLSTKAEKTELLRENLLDNLLVFRFSDELVQMSPDHFVERVLVNELKVREVVIGETHRFGRRKSGDYRLLRKLGEKWGFRVDVLSPVMYRAAPVSSTRIRSAVDKGQVAEANEMLGRDYQFTGEVVKGVGRGKRLQYPTANIRVDSLKLLPGNGVYAAKAELEGRVFPAAMNVGAKPTFGKSERSVEVHLLDFEQAIYGKSLKIRCIKRLRDERAFADAEFLRAQIEKDVKTAKEVL
jgi:riboflavin kinase/FMN adenylyltransferase